jgi:hypothetical protein
MYLANKVQNIRAPPTRCSSWPGSTVDEIRPVAEAMERGRPARAKARSRIAARQVPADRGHAVDCIAAIEEYRDAGCTHVMLELWGAKPARTDPDVRRPRDAQFRT